MRFSNILSVFFLAFLFSCSQSDIWEELIKKPDLIPPVVSTVSPRDGETDVSISKMSIKVQFSEQMNSSSFTEEEFICSEN